MEPLEEPDDRRLFALAAGLLWLGAAALILFVPVLPLQDAPTHLAVLHARERVLAGDPHYTAWFAAGSISRIYWLCYGILIQLSRFVSWEMALRLYLLLYLGAWAGALHLLLGRDPTRRWWTLLAAPLVFNGVWFLGFLNFLWVYPLSAVCVTLLSRGEPRGWRAWAALAGISLVTLVIHPLGWGAWMILAFPLALALHPGPLRGRVREALPLLAPLLVAALLMAVQLGEAAPNERPSWAPNPRALLAGDLETGLDAAWPVGPLDALLGTLNTLFPWGGVARKVVVVVLAAGLLASVRWPREGRSREQTVFLRAALAVLLVTPLLPFRFGLPTFFNIRLVPWTLLFLLCALPPLVRPGRAAKAGIAGVGALLLAAVAWPSIGYSREAGQLFELTAPRGARRTVLPVFLSIRSAHVPAFEHLIHLPSLLSLRQDWIHPHMWPAQVHIPIRHHRPLSGGDPYEPDAITAAMAAEHDFVLVAAQPDDPQVAAALERLLAGPLTQWELIDTRGVWRLYRPKPEVVEPRRND